MPLRLASQKPKLYLAISLFLVVLLGLWFNVKTVELNQKIHKLRRALIELKKENAYLEESVLSQTRFSEIVTFAEADFGRFQRDFAESVSILAWNLNGNWWDGVN